jgi:hypothetical protein
MMIKPNELIEGRYYEVKYGHRTYIVKAIDDDTVKVIWRNGVRARDGHTGSIRSATSIVEIPRAFAITGKGSMDFNNNKEAKGLLDGDY